MLANGIATRSRLSRTGNGERRGSIAFELVLVFPIVLAILVSMVEFSILLASRQQMLSASREGARVAALGGDQAAVELAVNNALTDARLQGNVQITAVLTDDSGNPLNSGDPVSVQLSIPTNQAAPDMLQFIGFSLSNGSLVVETVMRKE